MNANIQNILNELYLSYPLINNDYSKQYFK